MAPWTADDETDVPEAPGGTPGVAEDTPAPTPEDAAPSEAAAEGAASEPADTEPAGEEPVGEQPPAETPAGDDVPLVAANDDGELRLDLDGYEGPIDVLLTLAREQKVDLKKISILELADQYLTFINHARRLRLELAADYLVMAAWLAYLKSRLLLPEPPADGEPTGVELAAALAFQLQRLEAMQKAGQAMLNLPQLGRDVFTRGTPEPLKVIDIPVYELSLYELLKAYGTHPGRRREGMLQITPLNLFSMDDALKRIGDIIGHTLDWTILQNFLPDGLKQPLQRRAAVAATFAASLELARSGIINLRQEGLFGPIYMKRAEPAAPASPGEVTSS
ncbi:MAG: segregation/condensation protein A [Proteobacteria bacterium]|nr:segregation/condensation protein A [Pseudomonadota bacterium]